MLQSTHSSKIRFVTLFTQNTTHFPGGKEVTTITTIAGRNTCVVRIRLLPLDAAGTGIGRAAAARFDRRRGRHVDLLGDDLLLLLLGGRELLTAAAAVENINHCSAIVIATTTDGGGI